MDILLTSSANNRLLSALSGSSMLNHKEYNGKYVNLNSEVHIFTADDF